MLLWGPPRNQAMRLLVLTLSLLAAAPLPALTTSVIPEPSTISLVALGGAAGLFLAWRKKRNAKR